MSKLGGGVWLTLKIEKTKTEDDGWGDSATESWEEVREERFSLKPTKGEEYARSDQMESQVTHTARCHFFEGARSSYRLTGHGRTFNVEAVWDEDERHRWLMWELVEVEDGPE